MSHLPRSEEHTVKSSVETLSPTRVKLAVEVPFDELKSSLDEAYKAIGSQVRVPGFRPGKVPARIIDQRVGRGAVLQEAINDALPKLYSEAAREHELRGLGQPEIPTPEVEGIAVTVDDVEVSDADIDEQLDSLRERFGTLKGVDRPVED